MLVAEYNKAKFVTALARYRRTPGHWSSIDVDEGKRRFAMSGTPETRVFLASHHQKTCVVDGEVAFCGGMDITPLALDNPTHATRRHPFRKGENDLSWHDLHARLEGDVVIDLERNFRERWNLELLAFSARIGGFAAVMPAKGELPFSALTPIRDPGRRTGRTPGTDAAQVLRTISADKAGQFVPEIKREDIFEAYARAIGGAEQYVYLENQYFRSTPLTDAIIARHAEAPRLQVILVIPVAPEELTDLAAADPKALHPVAVQIKELKRLQAALGPNFGVFSLVLPQRARRRKFTDVAGSPQLYVHSKICIVDDEFATIGSANANGRSFAMDTELNVGWFQRSHVKRFRIDLWRHLLGRAAADVDTWPATAFTATWRAIATTNLLAPPAARSGFVVPHDFAALDAVAKEMPLVPPTFIDIADILPESASPDLVSADESRDELAAAPLS
ncbi:phospholipase D family protein [Accumulibacter sp.]|uniref:phospholipase D family protein n=1 Tax=Accumulibacter sp. TaxID=2053492 RepID=UPI002627A790|nr:phospholipase D-like domain-containing protein [Accumulibacter sp.]